MIKCDTTLGLKDSSTYADQLIWYTTWIEWKIKIMIISIDAKKKLTKFNILSYRVGTKGIYLSIIKVIYDEYTSNIIHNGERLKTFSLRSWARQRVSIPTTPFQHCIRSTSQRIRQ